MRNLAAPSIAAVALAVQLLASPALSQDAAPSTSPSPGAFSSSLSSMAPVEASTPNESDLEFAVRDAYSAATAFASAHGNYFARDGAFPPVHDAVAAALAAHGWNGFVVPSQSFADLDSARVCLSVPGAELRLVPNTYGDGLALVAVTDTRIFAYDYDPHKAADIKVLPAADCARLGSP